MTHWGERPCPDRGTQPHRSRNGTGGREVVLPAGFYDDPRLSAALARLDFGPIFRRVRVETRCSQHVLGALLGLDQATMSKIENGQRSLTDTAAVVRVANVLGIPAGKLGFRYGVTVGSAAEADRRGSWVERRRDFIEQVTALTFGATGVDFHRLLALVPQAESPGTRHLGASDVEVIEQATATYTRQDLATGSGPIRDLAVSHLRSVLPLLDAQIAAELRPRLMIATAHLALVTGFMSFDVTDHDAARRLWMIGLGLARDCEHPLGSDLTAYLLYDMASQAVHLGRPDEALKLVHIGQAAAVGAHPLSASTANALSGVSARAHAARGDARACDRALHQAEEQFASIDHQARPPWGAWLNGLRLAVIQGGTYYALARHERDPRAAGRAVPLLRHALDQFGPDHARGRALYLSDLAGAHAIAGDIDTAVAVGHQALDAVTAVHSPRAYGRLRALNTVLEPLHTSPGVAELRERLTATAL
ncbi:MAG: helix-turn-helix transcriptional regulator [Pseudonocardiales bacterium]|nr:helix-turn-helix transcriptional regulator [Pseudonocardiales bacterium]